NSQRIDPFPGEDRIMVKSPDVANFCDAPEMSSEELTQKVIDEASKEEYSLMVVNFPNPDLCGHGGEIDGVIKACETVDKSLSVLLPKLDELGYDWIVTSDHGNAEEMYYPGTDTLCVSHTKNQVQTFVKSDDISQQDLDACSGLKDIAPICLKILGIELPAEME
ncbi:MAG: alkaline phosphatase family protein, partial [Candidatus Peribacteraceae bacterium]|nr:alkaline phosphatase family protein [Candidatus Peribacteraceae bacterium]